jgi:hypothetical protein
MKHYILLFITILLIIIQSKLVISCSIYNCKNYDSYWCWPNGLGCCFPGSGECWDCYSGEACYQFCGCEDTTSPTYTFNEDNSGGSAMQGATVETYVLWNDDSELNYSVFRNNISNSWQNISSCSFSGASDWCNKTIVISSGDVGKIVCWNQWANDSSDNWNDSMPYHCFNVISPAAAPTQSIVESLYESIIKSVGISSEVSKQLVSLVFEFFVVVIILIILIILLHSMLEV